LAVNRTIEQEVLRYEEQVSIFSSCSAGSVDQMMRLGMSRKMGGH
jgi:hypothetical protein